MKLFRSAIAFLAVFAIAIGMLSFVAFAEPSKTMGDVNQDTKVDAKDVLLLRKYLAKWTVTIDETGLIAADMNFDAQINAKDLLALRKALAKISDLPEWPEQPDPGIEIPSNYLSEHTDDAITSQIGYANNSSKIARIITEGSKQTVAAYVVNADTKKAVFTDESASSRYDSITGKYVSAFDFSSVTETGTYYVQIPSGVSYTFKIEDQPYNDIQDGMITALYYNRCGQALDKNIVAKFYDHGVCHNDSSHAVRILNVFDAAKGIYTFDNSKNSTADKFSGGLHDAGDYGRYVTPANQVVADCIYMNELFGDGCDTDIIKDNSGENIADVLDEARYEMQWILKMQNPANGGVYFRIGTSAFSGWYDTPDNDTYYTGENGKYAGLLASRESVKATAGMIGNAAACYTAFKNIDPSFASQCLAAAKKGFEFVDKYQNDSNYKSTPTSSSEGGVLNMGEYGSTEFYGDIFYAAAAMFRATGDEVYNTRAKKIMDEKIFTGAVSATSLSAYDIGGAGTIAYLLNDKGDKTYQQKLVEKLQSSASSRVSTASKDKFGNIVATGGYGWGSNASMAGAAKMMAVCDYFTNTNTNEATIRSVMNFIFGANVSNYCFVTGYGSKCPENIHHRPSMYAVNVKKSRSAPGWVAGGLTGSPVYYEDVNNNYQTNEVCVYWNTSPSFMAAYLIHQDKK